MRLGIDARELCGRPTGVGRYLQSLLEHWRAEPDLDVVLYTQDPLPPMEGARVSQLPARSGTAWLAGPLPRRLQMDRPDAVFGPAYAIPFTVLPCAVTMHDLSFEVLPETFPAKDRTRRQALARVAAARASLILCDSAQVRDEIAKRYQPAAPIEVVPLGVGERFFAPPDAALVAALEARCGSARPRIGFAGSLFNRRHPEAIVAACAAIFRRFGGGVLIVAGENRTYPTIDIEAVAARERIAADLRMLSYIDDETLRALHGILDVFLWPSDYEGFGLPPLEAMAAGVPVVSTRRGCLEENLRGAALLVEENSAEALAAALASVLEDADLRERLKALGRERARRFAWPDTASVTLTKLRAMRGGH